MKDKNITDFFLRAGFPNINSNFSFTMQGMPEALVGLNNFSRSGRLRDLLKTDLTS